MFLHLPERGEASYVLLPISYRSERISRSDSIFLEDLTLSMQQYGDIVEQEADENIKAMCRICNGKG